MRATEAMEPPMIAAMLGGAGQSGGRRIKTESCISFKMLGCKKKIKRMRRGAALVPKFCRNQKLPCNLV